MPFQFSRFWAESHPAGPNDFGNGLDFLIVEMGFEYLNHEFINCSRDETGLKSVIGWTVVFVNTPDSSVRNARV